MTSLVQAQTRAMTQPTNVQPRNRLRMKIGSVALCLRLVATNRRDEVEDQEDEEERAHFSKVFSQANRARSGNRRVWRKAKNAEFVRE